MSMVSDFKSFLVKQNALALAVGVVIGGAIGKVVSGIVDDVIMPIVGVMLPGGEWRTAQVVLSGTNAIKYGDLIGRLVDFVIVAFVIFVVVKALIKEAPAAPTKACPQCLENLPVAAKKCRACASAV
jgi:large conductance mechanosensitive channel